MDDLIKLERQTDQIRQILGTLSNLSVRSDIKTVLHQDIIPTKYFVNRQVQAKLQKRNIERESLKKIRLEEIFNLPFSHFMILRKKLFLYFEFGRRLWTSVGNMTNT